MSHKAKPWFFIIVNYDLDVKSLKLKKEVLFKVFCQILFTFFLSTWEREKKNAKYFKGS